MRNLILALFFLSFTTSTFAFENDNDKDKGKKKKVASPDLPGALLIDIGFNFLNDNPEELDIGFWGSKTVNFYYYYDIPIGKSGFSFNPGFGLGLDKFSFDNSVTIVSEINADNQQREIVVKQLSELLPNTEIKKTKLAANYFDIPLELRFNLNKNNHERGIRFAVGGKVGFLLKSHTKIKYKEDGDVKISKQKENFGLNKIRYGAHARIGIGGFGFYGYYSLSELFQSNEGPLQTTTAPLNFGITFAGF
ncbi:outer membrane beta-barrel protein [Fulvivirgaceae bacterium BMA10]|uniref:Outer membrane beta-barrel protein n=1 Tax=Splendidivirga corallicola TaxID=3051826 RepID=A0ABT8KIX1_9BACT|nr:outer membrane beta-barrel protein [Fulvivirgaceae bacterium BMA10]